MFAGTGPDLELIENKIKQDYLDSTSQDFRI